MGDWTIFQGVGKDGRWGISQGELGVDGSAKGIFRKPYRFRHMKNKGVRQSHSSSLNSVAIDMRNVARHAPIRRVVACDNYFF